MYYALAFIAGMFVGGVLLFFVLKLAFTSKLSKTTKERVRREMSPPKKWWD